MAAPVIDEVRLPEDIAEGAKGGASYRTVVVEGDSGSEVRAQVWDQARLRWTITQGVRDLPKTETLIAFFRARKGKARGFRFKDWSDYQVSTPTTTVAVNATTFQLVKRYSSGGIEEVRTTYKPVLGTVHVFNGTTEVFNGFISFTQGTIGFAAAPGFTPKATFEFDVPVRFDTDSMEFIMTNAFQRDWPDIPLVELRP